MPARAGVAGRPRRVSRAPRLGLAAFRGVCRFAHEGRGAHGGHAACPRSRGCGGLARRRLGSTHRGEGDEHDAQQGPPVRTRPGAGRGTEIPTRDTGPSAQGVSDETPPPPPRARGDTSHTREPSPRAGQVCAEAPRPPTRQRLLRRTETHLDLGTVSPDFIRLGFSLSIKSRHELLSPDFQVARQLRLFLS